MKRISSYHELAAEKERLHQRLALLKREVDIEVDDIKRKFRPVVKIASMLGIGNGNGSGAQHSDSAKKHSLLKMGAALGIDLLVAPQLAKAGFLTRLLAPPLLRKISSAVISRFRKKK
jgi:hypothetical protein